MRLAGEVLYYAGVVITGVLIPWHLCHKWEGDFSSPDLAVAAGCDRPVGAVAGVPLPLAGVTVKKLSFFLLAFGIS